jgi:hypothetical protein
MPGTSGVVFVVRPSRPHMPAGRLRYKVCRIIMVRPFRPHMQAGRLRYKVGPVPL